MGYKDYLSFFRGFDSEEGYYRACKILSFDSIWREKNEYSMIIRESILSAKDRRKNREIDGADVCCGEYAWLPRHFGELFNKIYCVDLCPRALKSPAVISNNQCISLNKNAKDAGFEVDFIFCGNNVYSYFIDNLLSNLRKRGTIFLMKPMEGTDFSLREISKNYDLSARRNELKEIRSKLLNQSDLTEREMKFNWEFKNANLEEILAALSVVSFGSKDVLIEEDYTNCRRFMESSYQNSIFTISQNCSILEGIKNV